MHQSHDVSWDQMLKNVTLCWILMPCTFRTDDLELRGGTKK